MALLAILPWLGEMGPENEPANALGGAETLLTETLLTGRRGSPLILQAQ